LILSPDFRIVRLEQGKKSDPLPKKMGKIMKESLEEVMKKCKRKGDRERGIDI
jgi:hypothetical protein